MLQDDRKKYAMGTPEDKPEDKILGHIEEVTDEMREKLLNNDRKTKDFVIKEYGIDPDGLEMEIRNLQKRDQKLTGGQIKLDANKDGKISGEDFEMLRDQNAEGGDIDGQMAVLMANEQEPPMESDENMEDNYLDFIIDEALSEEEEDMLMSKLEQDEQLSMLFDKVIEVASEFAGSGPVEGPGSGVSDSIPARLSDGEFVFTAKAVEEIGSDNLMSMMKDAEARADERQNMANGGDVDEEEIVVVKGDEPVRQEIRVVKETVDSAGRMIEDEDEISKNIKSNMMLDPNQQHVRS